MVPVDGFFEWKAIKGHAVYLLALVDDCPHGVDTKARLLRKAGAPT
jgi:putative SOS response-associated peptidase YedK